METPDNVPYSKVRSVTHQLRNVIGLSCFARTTVVYLQGSIGTQTLDICREKPENFEVVSLAAGSNVDLLAEQISHFK